MRTEELKRTILMGFGSREFYGYEVHRELASENIKVGVSRLYRALTEMVGEGLLEARWEKSQFGPRKRVYRLGEEGRKEREKLLLDAIETVHSFYSEYLLGLPPEVSVFNSICRLLSSNLKGKGNIAYLTSTYSVTHEKMLCALHSAVPEGKIYLVKPSSLTVDLNLDNLLFLDGTHDNIPLRDGYVDLVIVAGFPEKDSLEASLREWHRVLRQRGTVAISTPTALVHEYEDPLTIGDFMEKCEHETLRKGQYVDRGFVTELLKRFFHKVEERQVVHITTFLATEPRSARP